MSLNLRDVVEHLYRYLRKEQRALPLMDPDLDDPLPEALAAINATLQKLAVRSPKFAAQRPMAALFHAPKAVAVTGLSREGYAATCAAWPAWAAGCEVQVPGDARPNRILSITGQAAVLQFPYLGDATGGEATVLADCVTLGAEVISLLPPVRVRGGGVLRPAGGRRGLMLSAGAAYDRSDFGRPRRAGSGEDAGGVYHADSVLLPGAALPRVQLRLAAPVNAETVVEFEARCSLGWVSAEDVLGETPGPVPVPAEHVESLFLPLVLQRFFGASVMRNTDAPPLVAAQAQEAELMLQEMRPQTERTLRFYPTL